MLTGAPRPAESGRNQTGAASLGFVHAGAAGRDTGRTCAQRRAVQPRALHQLAHFLPPNRFLSERPPLADEVTLGWGLLSSLPAMRLRTDAGRAEGPFR